MSRTLKSYVSVYDTDSLMKELHRFIISFFSENLNDPSIYNNIGVHILEVQTVSVLDPFNPCDYPYINKFRSVMKTCLRKHEQLIADRFYTGDKCIKPPMQTVCFKHFHRLVQARHEKLNT